MISLSGIILTLVFTTMLYAFLKTTVWAKENKMDYSYFFGGSFLMIIGVTIAITTIFTGSKIMIRLSLFCILCACTTLHFDIFEIKDKYLILTKLSFIIGLGSFALYNILTIFETEVELLFFMPILFIFAGCFFAFLWIKELGKKMKINQKIFGERVDDVIQRFLNSEEKKIDPIGIYGSDNTCKKTLAIDPKMIIIDGKEEDNETNTR